MSRIVTEVDKLDIQKAARIEAAAQIGGDILSIHHGDFREIGKAVDDESVDLIFTDPPYLHDCLNLYGDLGEFAARVLRPGGWCLAYVGTVFIPQVLQLMAQSLEYGSTFCICHSGGDARFRKLKIRNGWKPIVAFHKKPLSVWWDWFADCVSGGKEKSLHEWQQAEGEAAHFIEALSPAGGVVCDPFCGSGTTCAAAKVLGRKWIGFEIDREHVETARIRVNDSAMNQGDAS